MPYKSEKNHFEFFCLDEWFISCQWGLTRLGGGDDGNCSFVASDMTSVVVVVSVVEGAGMIILLPLELPLRVDCNRITEEPESFVEIG